VVAGLALLVAAGGAELLTRRLSLLDRLNGVPRRLYLATDLPDMAYRLRPGVTVAMKTFTIHVNALGLRGAETTQAPAPGRRRILVLGDSIVYGEGLNEPDTFPVLLEQELARRGGTETEVLNGAAQGYDTAAERTYLQEVGVPLAPDAVVLGVSLNDYERAPALTPFGFLTVDPAARDRLPWLSNRSEYYVLVRWLITYARGGHWFQHASASAGPPAPAAAPDGLAARIDGAIGAMHRHFYASRDTAKWARVREALAGLAELARTRGVEFAAVIFPEGYQIGVPAPDLAPQRAWLDLCAELGVRCLDLQPAFAAAAGPEPLFQDTQHPNAAGMRVAARAVADFIQR
jgi:lysophospholipase L1-like esterase